MELKSLIEKCRQENDYTDLVKQIPYARFIGIECQRAGDEVFFKLNKQESNIGNPTLPAIHGGVIAGFMEHSAIVHLLLIMEEPRLPKIIDFSIDYLRAGHFRETFSECKVWRLGRRVANVSIQAWQTKREEPIATARAQFLLAGLE